jgi:hypothetical protein
MEAPLAEPWFYDVLPCRPHPYAGECLTGYLLRLAEANHLAGFLDLVFDLFPLWSKTSQLGLLRWEYPVEDWGRIPLRTQLPLNDLRRLTVLPWLEKFRSPPVLRQPDRPQRSCYRLSPGHFLKQVIAPNLQVCPGCLQTQPYQRLLWRLAPVRICREHACLLQTHCQRCGAPLAVVGRAARHLRCMSCGTDLRTLPFVAASDDLLATQSRLQAKLQFLLDPDVTLVRHREPQEDGPTAWDRSSAVGLKFRYLRTQAGHSVAEMGRRLGVEDGLIGQLELGQRVPLPLYLTYLEAFSLSWPDFAALEVPPAFRDSLQELPHRHLRVCPDPACPSHQLPVDVNAGVSATVLADLPDRQVVRFRCQACGRSYTRAYDGKLMTRPRRSLLRPGDPPSVVKPAAQVARLTEMGLQGESNRQIAHQLGWGEKTVRMYWIVLGLEERVHQAQAQRRAQEELDRRTALRCRVEALLPELLAQDVELSVSEVSRALGHNPDYLQNDPGLKAYVQDVIQQHNARVRQERFDVLKARLMDIMNDLQRQNQPLRFRVIEQRAGIPCDRLQECYPELHALVRQAVTEYEERRKAALTQTRCARVAEAAARLVAQGARLTFKTILVEAGLARSKARSDPEVRELIRQWTADCAPRD